MPNFGKTRPEMLKNHILHAIFFDGDATERENTTTKTQKKHEKTISAKNQRKCEKRGALPEYTFNFGDFSTIFAVFRKFHDFRCRARLDPSPPLSDPFPPVPTRYCSFLHNGAESTRGASAISQILTDWKKGSGRFHSKTFPLPSAEGIPR